MYTRSFFFIILTLYSFAALMEKKIFFLLFSVLNGGKHKIHVSTRQSLVHDWRIRSFAVAKIMYFLIAWKWCFPENIKHLFAKTLNSSVRKHSIEHCDNAVGKLCSISSFHCYQFDSWIGAREELWNAVCKHAVLLCDMRTAFETFLEHSSREFHGLTHSRLIVYRKRSCTRR